jgi:MFS transporter, FSR family, fosmidomycin resistance protein
MKSKPIWILSLGHLITDVNQGALPAMLPFFIITYDLSYTAAASIVFAANLSSSIIQPLFGYAADRLSKPWLLSAGLILAGTGLGLTGLCENYQLIVILAIISGIGIAAYHPEAARLVNFEAGNQKNTAMSIFGVGGTIGFAIGPFLITTALLQWGMKGSLILLLPVSVMAIFMTTQFASFKSIVKNKADNNKNVSSDLGKENWWAFIRLTIVIIGRSIIFYGLNTFIPIYWINHLHQSKIQGSLALTIFAGSGILGNLAGGNLADKIGQKKVILTGFLGLAILLPTFSFISNPQVSMLLMFPIGLILYASYSPSIVLGQNYLPNRVGLSSGITLGVAISIGGAVTPAIGKIADIYGIWYGITSVACLPLLIFLVALSLPDPHLFKRQ